VRPVDAFLDILRSEGVDRIFGNPGTTELPLMEALARAPDLHYTLGLQEGSVVAMADGYARATRRPSFANLHVAAGVANGLIGMINASRSRTPMVITAGQQDRRHLLQDPMLSGDLVGIAGAIAKSAVEVQHARDLPLVLRRAFALATRPPAGPVLVSIPMDLLDEVVEVDVPARSAAVHDGVAAEIDAAIDRLAAAEAPAIVAGDGVGRAGAVAELVALAEALGAATYHQPMYDRVDFPMSHPLYAGMPLPRTDSVRAHLASHDVVFIVGCHAFMAHHYAPDGAIPTGTTVIQLDADAAELGRNFPVAVGLVGDLRSSIMALADGLAGRVPDVAARIAEVSQRTGRDRALTAAEVASRRAGRPLDPLRVVGAIAESLPRTATVVEEGITVGMLLRRVLASDDPDAYVHTVGGGLGWGIGAAIGTRLGNPERPVVAVLGDGSAMFGLQGLWTATHENVPVTFLVMNNGEYRTLKDTLDSRAGGSFDDRFIGLDMREPAIDWSAAGRAFGVPTRRIERIDELSEVLRGVEGLEGPLLVDIPIAAHPGGRRATKGGRALHRTGCSKLGPVGPGTGA
jgi:benzoylformate decarboxylase